MCHTVPVATSTVSPAWDFQSDFPPFFGAIFCDSIPQQLIWERLVNLEHRHVGIHQILKHCLQWQNMVYGKNNAFNFLIYWKRVEYPKRIMLHTWSSSLDQGPFFIEGSKTDVHRYDNCDPSRPSMKYDTMKIINNTNIWLSKTQLKKIESIN